MHQLAFDVRQLESQLRVMRYFSLMSSNIIAAIEILQ